MNIQDRLGCSSIVSSSNPFEALKPSFPPVSKVDIACIPGFCHSYQPA
jgi:hypothetical protein